MQGAGKPTSEPYRSTVNESVGTRNAADEFFNRSQNKKAPRRRGFFELALFALCSLAALGGLLCDLLLCGLLSLFLCSHGAEIRVSGNRPTSAKINSEEFFCA